MELEILKKIGLTHYEAKAYITLCSLISATAIDISRKSQIPRSKIYNVLKNLNEKGYVDIERGRPLKFNVKSPNEVINREKENIVDKLEKLASDLTEIYEDNISEVKTPIWRLFGEEKIIQKEIEIIKRSKKSINLRVGFLFENEFEAIIKALKYSDVPVNILASEHSYINGEKVELLKIFKEEGFNVYKGDVPFVKMLVSDSSEMLHVFVKFSEDKKYLVDKSVIGIWNQYEDIVRNYDERFLTQIKRIKSKL